MTNNIITREFGFLKRPIKGEFSGIEIVPLPDHSQRTSWFEKGSNMDGFFYPPMTAKFKQDPETFNFTDKVNRSERPALMFRIEASHKIKVNTPIDHSNNLCSDDSLIINLLGYIYGTRLQFSDWYFDGRIPSKSLCDISISDKDCLHFLNHVYSWWLRLDFKLRKKIINILYVLNRTRTLEWKWEQFIYQYMVFDAIFEFSEAISDKNKMKNVRHKERFDILLKRFRIPLNDEHVKLIYETRNNLFHEAL